MTTTFILKPIPNTNNYLITQYDSEGNIIALGVRDNEYLIENWGRKHSDPEDIVNGLREMAEIELYD